MNTTHTRSQHPNRPGVSLLEMLAAITIIGVIAAVIIPRLGNGGSIAKSHSCEVHREVIQIQAQMWRRDKGNWPSSSLSSIGADTKYFPEGLPTCPVDGSNYQLDTSTGLVIGHNH